MLENQWLEIRDLFFGRNRFDMDIPRSLKLASSCSHPEAQWLSGLFSGRKVQTADEARNVFLAQPEDDARALCFGEMILEWNNERDVDRLRRSSELGHSFAQAMFAWKLDGKERFKLAEAAAAQRERDGFRCLGCCFEDGVGCEKNLEKAKECFLICAELGHAAAMESLGGLFEKSDPQRWFWLGLAAENGESEWFLSGFGEQVLAFDSGSGRAAVVFAIGRALKGRVNFSTSQAFGRYCSIEPANRAILFFTFQLSSCRKAVDTWTIVASRLGVVRDVRKLIGQLIWETRHMAEYKTIESSWNCVIV